MSEIWRARHGRFSDLLKENMIGIFARPLHGDLLRMDFLLDIKDTHDCYLIRADLPGVKKEDILVSIERDSFTISAKIEQIDQKMDNEKIIQSERYFGSVSRTIHLPREINKSLSSAHFEHGILELKLAKKEVELIGNLAIN